MSPIKREAHLAFKYATFRTYFTFYFVINNSGTALDALSSMQTFLRSRPQQFKSLEEAVEWR